MKQFSLEKYLKNPSWQVVMRNGYPVRILCTDRIDKKDGYVIVGLLPHSANFPQTVSLWKADGKSALMEEYDLFFTPIKHTGWVNIYTCDEYGNSTANEQIFDSEEDAKSYMKNSRRAKHYITTGKIEWEE